MFDGKSNEKNDRGCSETGVLSEFPTVISPEDAKSIPKENLLLIVTGSQGGRRLPRHNLQTENIGITLSEGDLFIFFKNNTRQ